MQWLIILKTILFLTPKMFHIDAILRLHLENIAIHALLTLRVILADVQSHQDIRIIQAKAQVLIIITIIIIIIAVDTEKVAKKVEMSLILLEKNIEEEENVATLIHTSWLIQKHNGKKFKNINKR